MAFVDEIAKNLGVSLDNLLVQYLLRKTKAADRGSKARRSLGNLYALYVLAEDYLAGRTSRFTDLLSRMKALPFGSKLQNHPLDNRLNDEFARQTGVHGSLLPVQAILIDGAKARTISIDLLKHGEADPRNIATFVVQVIDAYVEQITANQSSALEEIQGIETIGELLEFFQSAFAYNSDARLFEIVSFVLLGEYYRGQAVYIGDSPETVRLTPLTLFRAGRTNANDGGIDFILKPLGRIFQVTETLDFKKYFLDFEKVNRYPVSFVIKTPDTRDNVMDRILNDASRSGQYSPETVRMYMSLFEEVFTLNDLAHIASALPLSALERVKAELSLQFQLEYGLLD